MKPSFFEQDRAALKILTELIEQKRQTATGKGETSPEPDGYRLGYRARDSGEQNI
jgi:hypothetical protein